MTDWLGVLGELDQRTRDVPVEDLWFFLHAVGLAEASVEEATAVVDMVAAYVPDLASKRVADLGCGAGRHLPRLLELGGEIVGIENSAALAEIARRFAADADVEHASFYDLAGYGAFDVVCAFSHCLLLVDDAAALVLTLQALRGAMPDYGLLVVEAMPAEPGETRWEGPAGVEVHETRVCTATGHLYRFEVHAHGHTATSELHAIQVSPAAWRGLAEESGFYLESARPFIHADGSSSVFLFLRAMKGFNYLSDLTEFLASWADVGHPRNARPVTWAPLDETERVRPHRLVALGQGSSLSKHHPDFARAVEDRIRPLVLELAERWNYVTYSSCSGHLISPGPRQVFTEAYCGIVVMNNRQIYTVQRLVTEAIRALASVHVEIVVRTRPLYGATSTLTAADVLFRRATAEVAWEEYADEVDGAVRMMAANLAKLRA